MDVLVRVLGPLAVDINGLDVTPPAPKERALFTMLLINRGHVVGADRLMEELWPTLDAERARRVLQVRVAAVRKLLGVAGAAALLELVPPGYRLAVADVDVDEHHFFELVERARGQASAGDPDRAALTLRAALGLWRGEPLADVQACVSLEAEAARLGEARLGALEDRIDADLACGRHQAVACELDALVVTEPLRERLCCQRILALYRCGRHAEALRACAVIRQRLLDEVGVEPGPALRSLEAAVLEQRSELDWSAPRGASHSRRRSAHVPTRSGTALADPVAPSSRGAPQPIPKIHYAKTADGVNLAYQVIGDGPLDLIVVPGYVSHLDTWWEAWSGRLVRTLASFSRLILFDKRGMGLSDRPPQVDVEQWMEDTRVVLDAVGSEQAALLGVTAGGLIAVLFAATYPERTRALVLYGAFARQLRGEGYPMGLRPEDIEAHIAYTEARWGSGVGLRLYCPSVSDDPLARAHYGRLQRASASPGAATAYLRALTQIDVRHALPMVQAPTLVLHARRDRVISVELARYMAERIPDATLVELDSADHLIWFSDALDVATHEIQDFLSGALPNREIRRVLTTIVFVDELDSTRGRSSSDRSGHGRGVSSEAKQLIERFRGHATRGDGDGIVVTFDGPARAIRCARAIVSELASGGSAARAGVHSGECEVAGDEISGVAVEIARGVADLADPGEVLVSQTVRDLVLGSSITFGGACSHPLRGVPGRWRVYPVTAT